MNTVLKLSAILLLFFANIYLGFAQSNLVDFEDFPQNQQLYQRSNTTNQAQIGIKGTADSTVISIRIRLYKNGNLELQDDFPIDTVQGFYNFDVSIDIQAELSEYRLEAFAVLNTTVEVHLKTASKILAGDVYLIMGQSNAKAAFQYTGTQPFLRSFSANQGWTNTYSEYGIWGKELAEKIVSRNHVPVLFFNTAVSSSTIADNSPNGTIFQHTQSLLDSANVDEHLKGFFWFQGESDAGMGTDATYYKNAFLQFDSALGEAISHIDKKYLIQIRNSCWANEPNGYVIQEVQRQLVDSLAAYSMLGTMGLEHDGCHFTGTGYMDLAEHLHGLVARDIYGDSDAPNTDAPFIEKAIQTDTNIITLITRDSSDVLEWIGAAESEFFLQNAGNVSIIAGFAYENKLILTTSDILPNGAFISYRGHSGGENTTPVVRNTRGLAIVAFHNFAIENPLQALEICDNGIDDDGNGLIDLEDAYCDCQTNPTVVCPTFDCALVDIINQDGRILLEQTDAPIFAVQIYDSNWQLLADTVYFDKGYEQLLEDVGIGYFNIIAKAFEADWTLLCERYFSIETNSLPSSDCSAIEIDTIDKKVIVSGLGSPIAAVFIFDTDWNTIYTFFNPPMHQRVETGVLPEGNYYVKASFVSDTWEEQCSVLEAIRIESEVESLDCSDIHFEHRNTEFCIFDLSAENKSIQIWDASWDLLFSCYSPNCPMDSLNIPLTTAGTVYAKVNYFNANWTELCGREEFVSNSAVVLQKTFVEGKNVDPDPVLQSKIRIFPNPTSESFSLFVPKTHRKVHSIQLLNAQGRVEMEQILTDEEHYFFDIRHLKKGMYWLKTKGEERAIVIPLSVLE